jgi:hypothetical protein
LAKFDTVFFFHNHIERKWVAIPEIDAQHCPCEELNTFLLINYLKLLDICNNTVSDFFTCSMVAARPETKQLHQLQPAVR